MGLLTLHKCCFSCSLNFLKLEVDSKSRLHISEISGKTIYNIHTEWVNEEFECPNQIQLQVLEALYLNSTCTVYGSFKPDKGRPEDVHSRDRPLVDHYQSINITEQDKTRNVFCTEDSWYSKIPFFSKH